MDATLRYRRLAKRESYSEMQLSARQRDPVRAAEAAAALRDSAARTQALRQAAATTREVAARRVAAEAAERAQTERAHEAVPGLKARLQSLRKTPSVSGLLQLRRELAGLTAGLGEEVLIGWASSTISDRPSGNEIQATGGEPTRDVLPGLAAA